MKKLICIFLFINVMVAFGSCSDSKNDNKEQKNPTTALITDISGTMLPNEDLTPTEEVQYDDYLKEVLKDYVLCGLKLDDSRTEIIKTLGEAKQGYGYELEYRFSYARLKCFMVYDKFTVTATKFLKVDKIREDDEDYYLTDIDLYSPDYTTNRGIKVGDSIEDVVKAYDIKEIFSMNSDSADIIYNMIKDRISTEIAYYDYGKPDYGNADKMAYINFFDDTLKISYRPSLIFLFENDVVTHIILHNWVDEVV